MRGAHREILAATLARRDDAVLRTPLAAAKTPQRRHAYRRTVSSALQHEHCQRDGEQPTAVEAVTPDAVAVPGGLAESVEDDKVGEGMG
jgi:hypothetical protein